MEILTLWPLSQGEIEGVKEGFVDAVFAGDPLPIPDGPGGTPNLHELLLRGGYPEVLSRSSESLRRAWFGSYVTTILQRDVRDLSNIEGLTELPRLLSLLAARSASLVNYAELSRSASMPQSTLKRYVSLLEATFLVERPEHRLRGSHRNLKKSDPSDAEAAARAVLAGEASGEPKSGDGHVEMIRALRAARRSAIKART